MNDDTKKEQEFLREQLFKETFQKEDLSVERVESIVKLMESNDPTDQSEIKTSQKQFEAKFKASIRPKNRIRQFSHIAAAIVLFLLCANLTTEAMFDESVFHMFQSWGNNFGIIPGDNDIPCEEYEVCTYTNPEEFAIGVNSDFLTCTWLPEGYKLTSIDRIESGNDVNYQWVYSKTEAENIKVFLFDKRKNDIASLGGSEMADSSEMILENGLHINVCANDGNYYACFESGCWWYVVTANNENNLIHIIERMENYE